MQSVKIAFFMLNVYSQTKNTMQEKVVFRDI
jgi:hypothetical protein